MSAPHPLLERFDLSAPPLPEREEATAGEPGAEAAAVPGDGPAPAVPGEADGPPPRTDTAESLARIAAALEGARAEIAAAVAAARAGAAEALGRAAAEALPSLADAAFPCEAADAALALAGARPAGALELRLAPDEIATVAAGLVASARPGAGEAGLALRADPALSSGSARLVWTDGGAGIEAARLAEAARGALARHLPAGQPRTAEEHEEEQR